MERKIQVKVSVLPLIFCKLLVFQTFFIYLFIFFLVIAGDLFFFFFNL